jgi:hypothetical protein
LKNIECFNLVASRVLLTLLSEFPKPIILDARQLQNEMTDLADECKWTSHVYHNITACTISYLVDEGFVRDSGGGRGPAFANAVLTAKGFTALSRKLDALEPSKTVGQRLLEAGKAIGPDVAGAVVARFLQSF